jgi:Bacterial Ig domain
MQRSIYFGMTIAFVYCISVNAAENQKYSYDALGRLILIERTGSVNKNLKTQYQLDRVHNRNAVTVIDTTVPIIITNNPPIAVNDTTSAICGQGGGYQVLLNDSDPDGNPITLTGASVISGPGSVNGINVAQGVVQFLAGPGLTTTIILYTISDGQGGTASANLTVNKAPFQFGC